MQPSTPSKPVMDVAAPKNPAPNPFAQPRAAVPQPLAPPQPRPSAPLPVRPAPLAAAPAPAAAPVAVLSSPAIKSKKPPATPAAANSRHTPVALITVTVFVMLVLSALAVTVYVTSKTA